MHDALKKTVDHPRIIFIEVSRCEGEKDAKNSVWMKKMVENITDAEQTLTIDGDPAPSAYLFITNRPFVHDIDGLDSDGFYSATGFKIGDFPFERKAKTILQMHRLRKKHTEPYALLRAFQDHWDMPQTFDERLPSEAFGKLNEKRLLIGNSYLVPDASGNKVPAKLLSAVVMEHKQSATGVYSLHDGSATIMCKVPLSDEEMEMYRQSPKTFFGTIDGNKRSSDHPLDLFDFFFDTYSKSSKENLLKWMSSDGDVDQLEKLSQSELAEKYCAAMATQIWANSRN